MKKLAVENGATLSAVKEQMEKNWHESYLQGLADDGPYGRIS